MRCDARCAHRGDGGRGCDRLGSVRQYRKGQRQTLSHGRELGPVEALHTLARCLPGIGVDLDTEPRRQHFNIGGPWQTQRNPPIARLEQAAAAITGLPAATPQVQQMRATAERTGIDVQPCTKSQGTRA